MYQSDFAGRAPATFTCRSIIRTGIAGALLCASQFAAAASVLAWDFDDGSGGFLNAPATSAAGINGSAWTDLHGSRTVAVKTSPLPGSPAAAWPARRPPR